MKKLTTIFLILAMCICMLPLGTFAAATPTPISSVTLTGLTKPVIGQPVTTDGITVSDSEKYKNIQFVWACISDDGIGGDIVTTGNFEADKKYAFGVMLECNDEYIFENDAAFNVNGISDGFLSGGMVVNEATRSAMDGVVIFTKESETAIDTVNITEVTPPVLGATASFDFNIDSSEAKLFEISGQKIVVWYESDAPFTSILDLIDPDPTTVQYLLDDTFTFKDNKYYTFGVGVIPNSGYTFDNNTTFKINGINAEKFLEEGAMAVYYTFPKVTSTPADEYYLWLGGTQVTSANAYNVFNDGTAVFDNDTKTLTLNGYTNSSLHNCGFGNCAIYSDSMDLNIILADDSENTLLSSGSGGSDVFYYMGIYVSGGDLAIDGSGTLNIDTVTENQYCRGIAVYNGDCEIRNGTLIIESSGEGVYAESVTFSGGTLYNKGGAGAYNLTPTAERPIKLSITEDEAIGGTTVWTKTDATEENFTLADKWTKLEHATARVTVNDSYAETTGEGDYYAGETVTINAGTRKGYSFKGWTSSDVTITDSEKSTATFTMPDNEVTVTADWKRNSGGGGGGTTRYTVNFETNGGSKITSSTVTKNNVVKEPAAPTKEGFTFDGWYADKELNTEYDFAQNVTKSFTLYAKWIENKKPTQPTKPTEWQNPFVDVNADDWFYDYVKAVCEQGLMNGVSETKFAPDDMLTRAMFVTVLYRMENEPLIQTRIFSDVANGEYYTDAANWAGANGIVNGVTETEFIANDNITREQMAAILYRYAQYKGMDIVTLEENLGEFKDSGVISEYAVSAFNWAVGTGIISGKPGGILDPIGNATRAETAAMLVRILNLTK